MENKKMKMLKIYLSSTDKINHVLLYEIIAQKAKEFGMSGATAARAMLGYGPSTTLRNTRYFELVEKYPVVMELVDEADKVDGFIKHISPLLQHQPKGCMMFSHDVDIHLLKLGAKE